MALSDKTESNNNTIWTTVDDPNDVGFLTFHTQIILICLHISFQFKLFIADLYHIWKPVYVTARMCGYQRE